jgi:glutathionyl-hydroquinone reductase
VKPIFERTKESDEHLGWVFPAAADEEPGAEPNPLNGARSVRELYEIASSNYAGKPTIPVSLQSRHSKSTKQTANLIPPLLLSSTQKCRVAQQPSWFQCSIAFQVLWDKQLKTVVNNESSEIIRMLNAEFNGIARNPGLDEFLFLFLLCMFI